VSRQLLLKHFHEVDLVEPSEHLLNTARKKLPHGAAAQGNKVANFFHLGLQTFSPEPARLVG
jgi:protein N-terminal methyltransferase